MIATERRRGMWTALLYPSLPWRMTLRRATTIPKDMNIESRRVMQGVNAYGGSSILEFTTGRGIDCMPCKLMDSKDHTRPTGSTLVVSSELRLSQEEKGKL